MLPLGNGMPYFNHSKGDCVSWRHRLPKTPSALAQCQHVVGNTAGIPVVEERREEDGKGSMVSSSVRCVLHVPHKIRRKSRML